MRHIFAERTKLMKASEIRELLKLIDQPDIISFAGGIPDPALFPQERFKDAIATSLMNPNALQYSTTEGYLPLREWIADRMRTLDVDCGVDNILITSGSQQALDYLGKLYLSAGDTAIVPWPCYMGALGAFNSYEPRYDRLNPGENRSAEEYAETAQDVGSKIKFTYLSADFSNPTGQTVDRAERMRLIETCNALDCALIEDGAYQELRYEGEAIAPILALEIAAKGSIEACRTVYCGSFSKTLAPGLRVGWVCAASEIISQLVLIKQAGDLHSATLNQMAVHQVASAGFDAHVQTLRECYSERCNAMEAALMAYMPAQVSWQKPKGGMFFWLTLPSTYNTATLLQHALQTEKVAFVPGAGFFPEDPPDNTLRLSFSCAAPEVIDEGIRRLAKAIGSST